MQLLQNFTNLNMKRQGHIQRQGHIRTYKTKQGSFVRNKNNNDSGLLHYKAVDYTTHTCYTCTMAGFT